MLDGFGSVFKTMLVDEKVLLLRDADDAFNANDVSRCLNAINLLYSIFDAEMTPEST